MTTSSLLVELFTEELPPKALPLLGRAFADGLAERLQAQGLIDDGAAVPTAVTPYASPRRLAAHLTGVRAKAADRDVAQKLMPAAVGLDASGAPTPALLKKLASLGLDASAVGRLRHEGEGKAQTLFIDTVAAGSTLADGLQAALHDTLARLPIPKVMAYQLADGWSTVKFVRPAHGLLALHGAEVVPIQALGLTAGRQTHGHRFEAQADPIVLRDADSYAAQLRDEGAVIASFAERRAEIDRQLQAAAQQAGTGLRPLDDAALLDEVTALVERPNVLLCQFDSAFLDVPQECLILTMKANQKYFPLLNAAGKLTHHFLVVSNVSPADPSAVIEGNERVVRPRLADAQFFFNQDRKRTLESRVPGLDKVVYHARLGSQGERAARVRTIAEAIATSIIVATGDARLAEAIGIVARLAKTDLLTDMVGEFPELQGIMGHYYALNDFRDRFNAHVLAEAIEDHYKPRFAGDALPRSQIGLFVALADKLETLVGLFGIGEKPTGDKDPFALRRHALGVLRMLMERADDLPALQLDAVLQAAASAFTHVEGFTDSSAAVRSFLDDRLANVLREQGYTAQEVDAVLALGPQILSDVPRCLDAVHAFSALPEAEALAAANKRVGNILKKSDASADAAALQQDKLVEPAEIALARALDAVAPQARQFYAAGDYTASLRALAALKAPVDAFFDNVMVNADDPALRANRLALLARLQAAMNQVADLSRLAA
ncbi:MAG: glycine--tRNA ligase subunit beta [Betaproteobacteria bacterium]|nr:glycine--tRNA ligase subunit beta [Betaproteobacteria bacterium]MDE2123829.1 glycine--tRNA ligase subunit beta [Betaproteobacteria bacterium]MDE2187682.1 glycine--tRNA ligase subunit beta [Betaproteobacteria bacterium]MDE2324728.1 glycine--tRNA ligase subunit beta [Betaproteobacteria bacterium]